MACRFLHGSATPSTLDLSLVGMTVEPTVPKRQHQTDSGTILQYVIGTYVRKGSIEVMVTTPTEHNNFIAFYRSATAANTRFTFIPDATNLTYDNWSAFFISEPHLEYRRMPAGRIVAVFRADIQDVAVAV